MQGVILRLKMTKKVKQSLHRPKQTQTVQDIEAPKFLNSRQVT